MCSSPLQHGERPVSISGLRCKNLHFHFPRDQRTRVVGKELGAYVFERELHIEQTEFMFYSVKKAHVTTKRLLDWQQRSELPFL